MKQANITNAKDLPKGNKFQGMNSFPRGIIRDDNDATENEYVSNEVATANEEKFGRGAAKASSQSKGDSKLGQSAKPLRDIKRPPKMKYKYIHTFAIVSKPTHTFQSKHRKHI